MSVQQDWLLGIVNSLIVAHEDAGSMKEAGEFLFGPVGEKIPLMEEISANFVASKPHHKDHVVGDLLAGLEDGKQKT